MLFRSVSRHLGIPPAYAGKRLLLAIPAFAFKDHPRIRGEKTPPGQLLSATLGSPPHTRGKVLNSFFLTARSGITPAYAGKRCQNHLTLQPLQDHPRIRGEKVILKVVPIISIGSPPHTRGKVGYTSNRNTINRITPAYAGKRNGWNHWLPGVTLQIGRASCRERV